MAHRIERLVVRYNGIERVIGDSSTRCYSSRNLRAFSPCQA